jgi:hypothetical protein
MVLHGPPPVDPPLDAGTSDDAGAP